MTAQQTLWKRALSTRPSGRNECLGRNLPNFPGLHCVLAVTHLAVSSSVSVSPPVTFLTFFQRQITEQNLTHACLTGTIPNFIIFEKMKDKLVVNSITEFDRYWSGNSRVTADLLSDLTVLIRGFFQRQITEHN